MAGQEIWQSLMDSGISFSTVAARWIMEAGSMVVLKYVYFTYKRGGKVKTKMKNSVCFNTGDNKSVFFFLFAVLFFYHKM